MIKIIIEAKYDSKCPICGILIYKKMVCEWVKGQKSKHLHCHDGNFGVKELVINKEYIYSHPLWGFIIIIYRGLNHRQDYWFTISDNDFDPGYMRGNSLTYENDNIKNLLKEVK